MFKSNENVACAGQRRAADDTGAVAMATDDWSAGWTQMAVAVFGLRPR